MIAKVLIIYLLVINVFAFVLFGIDKYKAKRNLSRISEQSLFLVAFLFGSVGAWTAMYFYHHKTKHLKFTIGLPVIILVQFTIGIYFLARG